jgi:hypothetical protein
VKLHDLPPDQAFVQLDEIFHLEDQLAGLATEQPSDANEK